MNDIGLSEYVRDEILKIQDTLRTMYYTQNIGFSTIRLLFLKYAMDNTLCAESKEDMRWYMNLQKQFAARDVGAGPNGVWPILCMIDEHFKLYGVIKRSINGYASELYGLDKGWYKRAADAGDCGRLMDILSRLDLTETDSAHNLGKSLVKELVATMRGQYSKLRVWGGLFSRDEPALIARDILQVKDNEMFLDFTSGTGVSTMQIVEEKNCNIYNVEINEDCSCVAAMLYIMSGYNNFSVICANGLVYNYAERNMDKIFVDAPISMKINNPQDNTNVDSNILAIYRVLAQLKNDGSAVLTVPSSLLFGKSKQQLDCKQQLIESGFLKAVISLPISWYGTSVTMNLLCLSNKQCKDVLFVNAVGAKFNQYVIKDKPREITISQDGIKLITDVVNGDSVVDELSALVSNDTIVNNRFDLMPTTYVKEQLEEENVTIQEIDDALAKLYAQLIKR